MYWWWYTHVMNPIFIIKEDGVREEFDPLKLEDSLIKSGAQPTMADKIIRTIVEEIHAGVCDPTAEEGGTCSVHAIYRKAFEMLKQMSAAAAARYSLRRSIMEFGPTGFPFEEYVAEIYRARGYKALVGQMVLGGCVPHEVDVIAWKENELIMLEVKYHNDHQNKTDLKVALYVKARYDDIKDTVFEYEGMTPRKIDNWILLTNTKFTETAIRYAECKGLNMIGWTYPEKENLLSMIEETKLHPITCLTTLSNTEKSQLLEKEIVLCKTLYEKTEILKELGLSKEKIFAVLNEVSEIINLRPRE
ncbi:MAG: ATPase [Candidatus Taylorbacteria bacterium]|nr:ATPase [Candidatus Taylorbacteria bacterium]